MFHYLFPITTMGLGPLIVGLVIMGIGFAVIGRTLGWIVTAVGLIPLVPGLFNVCLLAPLIRVPFSGKDSLYGA
jgi:hypothetical protein